MIKISKAVKKVESYQELIKNFQNALEHSVKEDGFVGVKVHLAEEVGFGVFPAWEDEAVSVFAKAKAGDAGAYKNRPASLRFSLDQTSRSDGTWIFACLGGYRPDDTLGVPCVSPNVTGR